LINGDIKEFSVEITLKKETPLEEILEGVTPHSDNFRLMITARNDGTSALIDSKDAGACTLVKNENGAVNMTSSKHPPVARIKNILEITVITDVGDDFRVVYPYGADSYSYGSSKLMFYTTSGEQSMVDPETGAEYTAHKYLPKSATKIGDFADAKSVYAYFDNFSIKKADAGDKFAWHNGRIYYEGTESPVFGIVAGADNFIGDAYFAMKDALDANKKVITILPDGLSLEQVINYSDSLNLLKNDCKFAASTHPARSNVALASIVTGCDPHGTGITAGGFKTPNIPDIFACALQNGKTAAYIEGDSALIGTPSIEPVLTGKNDSDVYFAAISARVANPDLLFVHFHGIDDVNHLHTPESSEARDKILQVEGYISELIKGFEGRVIIIPDHGHITVTEGGELRGNHGYFMPGDMFVPYYILDL